MPKPQYRLDKSSYYFDKYKEYYGHDFGSRALKRACWRKYLSFLRSSIDYPRDDMEVCGWLDSIASEKVNNPKDKFYMKG